MASVNERGTNFYRKHGPKCARHDPRIALVTAFHGRPELTRQFMGYYGGKQMGRTFLPAGWPHGPLIGAGDVEDTGRDDARSQWQVLEYENIVSDRFNLAVRDAMSDSTVDGVMIVGSDDFMSPNLISKMVQKFCEGYDFVGCDGLFFYDQPTKRCRYVQVGAVVDGVWKDGAVGAGRLLGRELLERLGDPYKPGLENTIDITMCDRMRKLQPWALGAVVHVDDEHCLVDVKCGENLWGYERWTAFGADVEPWFIEQFGI